MMTWGEFKLWVEARGVGDTTYVMNIGFFDVDVDELVMHWNEDEAGRETGITIWETGTKEDE